MFLEYGHMWCVVEGMKWYLSFLVGNILENYNYDDFWSSLTGGLEVTRFAVYIDLLLWRFAVYIDIFKQQLSNRCLIGSM